MTARARALTLILAAMTAGTLTTATPAVATPAVATPAVAPAAFEAIPEPDDDPFYRPPAGFGSSTPGTILRTREVDARAYGLPVPARVHQILVRSTDTAGAAIANVSTVFVPLSPPIGDRPLLSYQIATDSLGTQCNPSYRLRNGTEMDVSGVASALGNGWALVITDYQGPRMAWTAGRVAGQSVLDGVRGALALPEAGLRPDSPVGVWGYSGGGQATAWAAELQTGYAPELNIAGFVAGAFPGDLKRTLRGVDGGPAAGFSIAGAVGLSREYPQLAALFTERGRAEAERVGDLCLAELLAANPFATVRSLTAVDPFTDPTIDAVLRDTSTGTTAPSSPVLIPQSAFDELIRPEYNRATHDSWCAAGATVEYRLALFGGGHVTYAIAHAGEAIAWLSDRFAGRPAPSTCR